MKTTKEELLKLVAKKDLIIAKMENSRKMVIDTFRNVLGFRVSDNVWRDNSEPLFGFNEIFVEVGKLLAKKTDSETRETVAKMGEFLESLSKEFWEMKNQEKGYDVWDGHKERGI